MDSISTPAGVGEKPTSDFLQAGLLSPQQQEFAQVVGREIARSWRESQPYCDTGGRRPAAESPSPAAANGSGRAAS
jgi:hypothetical protein